MSIIEFHAGAGPGRPIVRAGQWHIHNKWNADFYFETALENKMALACHTGMGIPFALPSAFMIPARDYPQLKFVLAHRGGGGILLVAAVFCPNIYLELSSLMPHHVLEVLTHVASSRLICVSLTRVFARIQEHPPERFLVIAYVLSSRQ